MFDDNDVNSMFKSFINTFYGFFILVFVKLRNQALLLHVMGGKHQLLKPYVALEETFTYLLKTTVTIN
jgi:hypothetical protein